MRLVNKKWLLIIGGFVVLVIAGLVVALGSGHKAPSSQVAGQHVDTFSGETVSSPPGKTPENYGTNAGPLFLGFDKLLSYGLDTDQLGNLHLAFENYSSSLAKPLTQISASTDGITTQHNLNDPSSPTVIIFKVQFDSKNIYQAKVEYTGLSDVHLFIVDPSSSKQIYDSGIITSSPS